MSTKHLMAVATVVVVSMFAFDATFAADVAGAKPPGVVPTVKIFGGAKCVDDTEIMRRNHMDLLSQQSDDTMRRGIRTTKYSLKNCVNCHADPKTNSVLGKNGFCETCHAFTATKLDCFTCHSPLPEKKDSAPKATRTPSHAYGSIQR